MTIKPPHDIIADIKASVERMDLVENLIRDHIRQMDRPETMTLEFFADQIRDHVFKVYSGLTDLVLSVDIEAHKNI